MNIVLLVPDGVGLRNYLYSDLLGRLAADGHRTVIWHGLSESAIKTVESVHGRSLPSYKLPAYRESRVEKLLREVSFYARLKHNVRLTRNQTLLLNFYPLIQSMKQKVMTTLVKSLSLLLGPYSLLLWLESLHQRIVQGSAKLAPHETFLKTQKTDVVFVTHLRSIQAIPAVWAAEKLGIKTVGAIFSWDNVPKASLTARTRDYVVWSEYMKTEMSLFHPEVETARVHVTGTPQFDFYRDESLLWSRQQFFQRVGLDPDRPVVCFSGNDEMSSPDDPDYLEDLARAVAHMDVRSRPQVLFRRCPVDASKRFDRVLSEFPGIVTACEPEWNFADDALWSSAYPSYEDVRLLVNLAKHCDAVYNVGSTMAHDFAQFDKPAIYINYDQENARGWSINTVYRFEHFKSMGNLDCVVWLNRKSDIPAVLREVIEQPTRVATERQLWTSLITARQYASTEKIARVLV